jgi:hypothetical protein
MPAKTEGEIENEKRDEEDTIREAISKKEARRRIFPFCF